MIVLNQTGTTDVILELIWNASGSTPIYLFEINKKNSPDIYKSFIAEDVTLACCRYQRFVIENNPTEQPLNGIVYLLPNEYEYTIYQVDSISLSANKIKTLAQGLMYVKGTINSIYQ